MYSSIIFSASHLNLSSRYTSKGLKIPDGSRRSWLQQNFIWAHLWMQSHWDSAHCSEKKRSFELQKHLVYLTEHQ